MDTGNTISIEDVFHDDGAGLQLSATVSARKAQQSGNGKAEGAFLTISEVADSLGVPQHVLRFWETKFTQIRPLKRGGGRRYYRPEDVALLRRIHALLYTEGYTIRGAQKLLKGQARLQVGTPSETADGTAPPRSGAKKPPHLSGGEEDASLRPPSQQGDAAQTDAITERYPNPLSADAFLASLLPDLDLAPAALAPITPEESPMRPAVRQGLTAHQRRIMEGLLEDLRALRALVAAAESENQVRNAS